MAPVTAGPAEPGVEDACGCPPGRDKAACVAGAADPPSATAACMAGCHTLSPCPTLMSLATPPAPHQHLSGGRWS